MSVWSSINRPRRVASNGVSGAGLSTTVLPVANAWPSLLIVTSNGKFHGTMAPTTPTGSRQTLMEVVSAPVRLITRSPRSVSQAYSSISRAGYFSPSASGASSCGPNVMARGEPDFEDEFLAQLLFLRFDRVVQLQQAALTQLVVGRPVGLVEGPAGGVDGPVHVLLRRVGDLPERLLGGRVDVGEGAGLAVDQLAVDHHLRLEADLYSLSHVCCAFVVGTLSRAPGRRILWEALPEEQPVGNPPTVTDADRRCC